MEAVVRLLQERNQTLPEYTRWKYSAGGLEGFRGVLALRNGVAFGCFGVVPRLLKARDGELVRCGWFADWFVSPKAQGAGIGSRMLEAVRDEMPVVFGHPAPAKARSICLSKGFEPLAFSSRRRLVLHPLRYELRRTRYGLPVALPRCLNGLWRSRAQKRSAKGAVERSTLDAPSQFTETEAFGKWIMSQPVRRDIRRSFGCLFTDDLRVQYADDAFINGEIRRRVLHSEGVGHGEASAWHAFSEDAIKQHCSFVELFTTDRAVDHAWAALGARCYPDAPVLVAWKGMSRSQVLVHGWDRENWTQLADGAQQQTMNE